jgi:hypothetical protein
MKSKNAKNTKIVKSNFVMDNMTKRLSWNNRRRYIL